MLGTLLVSQEEYSNDSTVVAVRCPDAISTVTVTRGFSGVRHIRIVALTLDSGSCVLIRGRLRMPGDNAHRS